LAKQKENKDKIAMDYVSVSVPEVITDSGEEKKGPMVVRFKATKVNVINDNNRLYPNEVMTDAVDRSKKSYVETGKMVGETPHPKSFKGKNGQVVFDTKLENSVIKGRNLFMKNGEVFLDAEILETTKGKDLKVLIDQKVPVGISMRALGNSVQRNINGKVVDIATFLDIQSFDIVMNPATEGCGVVEVLTDSQVQEILDESVVEDGIQHTEPMCPSCNVQLNPVDPDNDGDIDFYECPTCGGIFFADNYLSSSINASTELRKMNTSDYDRYSQAQNYLAAKKASNNTVTDSKKGDDIVDRNDLLKLINEDPELRKAMEGIAVQTAKPALDAVEAQKQEEEKAKARIEAKTFVDEKIAALKEKMDDKVIKVITDAVGEPENKEQAQVVLDAALKVVNDASAAQILAGLGYDGKTTGEGGIVHVTSGESAKPWMDHVDKLVAAFDDYGAQFGNNHDDSLRKYNRKFVDKILEKYETTIGGKALTDSVEGFENLSDSVSVTTAQLLNQPTILTAVLIQAFQDVESLQFLMSDTFQGSEWRIPVETFTSAATPNLATGLLDILVPENTGIPESSINLTWQSYNPSWRRNAVSLTTDVVNQLKSGPAKYEAIARAIYHIGEDKRRKLDNASYYEMILASDEYQPLVIASESVATDHLLTVSNDTNVTFKALLNGKGALELTKGTNPIIRPRTKNVIQPNGQVQQIVINQFGVSGGTANPQVMGYLDSNGNIAGTNATYAVDWENGIVYFNAASGVDATHLPSVNYSAVTNYDRWSMSVPSGMKAEDYYNTLLQRLTNTSAIMGSAPRYKKPNLAIFSLNAATFIENASIFYKLASPDGTRLIPTSNYFGERSGMNLAKINSPWVVGDGRILLTQKGSTRYGVETPYVIEGPYPKYDPTTGQIIDAKLWYGRENSVLCTPQVTDVSGNIINPVSRTIKFV
jgi:Zn-finger nucleic acid-binding protein